MVSLWKISWPLCAFLEGDRLLPNSSHWAPSWSAMIKYIVSEARPTEYKLSIWTQTQGSCSMCWLWNAGDKMIHNITANLSLKNELLSVPKSSLFYFIKWAENLPWIPPGVVLSQFIRLVVFQSVQSLPACLHQKVHLEHELWPTRNLHKHI